MGFELDMSAKRDPREGRPGDGPTPKRHDARTIAIGGILDEASVADVLATVSTAFAAGADSVVVMMEDVVADDGALHALAAGLMSIRSAGRHVQALAPEPGLNARLSGVPNARDWLLDHRTAHIDGGRRAFHVDGSRPQG